MSLGIPSNVKKPEGLLEFGKRNPIIEYIKIDGVKIEYEISQGRKVVPGGEVRMKCPVRHEQVR